jgi:hypothetical protein
MGVTLMRPTLFKTPSTAHDEPDMLEHDPLRPARGIVNGLILSVIFWTAVALLFVMLTGCTTLDRVSERAAKRIGQGVHTYCGETTAEVRDRFRQQVNEHATPHEVRVTCADGEVLSTE